MQGKDAPCEFCTNGKLSQDKFYVWYHSNPIAHRHYLVKDKLISWQGKWRAWKLPLTSRIKEKQRLKLEKRTETEDLILSCVKILHEMRHINEAVGCIMERIGTALDADRVYILKLRANR